MGSTLFGDRLRSYRQKLRLSQQVLADEISCSLSLISKLEQGLRTPSRQVTLLLIKALNIPPAEQAQFLWSALNVDAPLATPTPPLEPSGPLRRPSLFGRAEDLLLLQGLLASPDSRLVTLVGPGGIGKTRLARELQALAPALGFETTLFVDLSVLAQGQQVLPAIASACALPDAQDAAIAQQLGAWFGRQRTLLILDNFEHVLDAAPAVAALLASTPMLVIVATSRHPLAVAIEHEWRVTPVAVPGAGINDVAVLAEVPAVALLLDRIRTFLPNFQLTKTNAAAIAGICVQLEGYPLALELVTGWLRFLTPQDVLARLDQPLPLLTQAHADAVPRHRTMDAAIRWSYDLLSPSCQQIFALTSVFRGGLTVAAITHVALALGHPSPFAVLEDLDHLVTGCLLYPQPQAAGETRLTMHGVVREFAATQLAAAGLEDQARQIAAEFFATAIKSQSPLLGGVATEEWLAYVDSETENWRAALTWFVASAQTEPLAELCVALWRAWLIRGQMREGIRWHQHALAGAPLPPSLNAMLLNGLAGLQLSCGHYSLAEPALAEALQIWQRLGDLRAEVRTRNQLGLCHWNQGRLAQAREIFDAARLICLEAFPTARETANILCNLGCVADDQGDYAFAHDCYSSSLRLRLTLGDQYGAITDLLNLGHVALRAADLSKADAFFAQSQELALRLNDPIALASCALNRSIIVFYQGTPEPARADILAAREQLIALDDHIARSYAESALCEIALATGDVLDAEHWALQALAALTEAQTERGMADIIELLAEVAYARQELRRATRLLGFAHALRERIGMPVSAIWAPRVAKTHAATQAALDSQAWTAEWRYGAEAHARKLLAISISDAPLAAPAYPLTKSPASSLP